jgi:purine-cytosine permease-like protein
MGEALKPIGGFGKFLLVIMAMSIVGCNIVNNYSLAFSAQNLGDWALKVPRFVWTIVGSIVYIVFAIAGEESFAEILADFLTIVGYWSTPFYIIVTIEHFYFRKTRYPLEGWNDIKQLPTGFAGIAAICMAFVGAVLGMDMSWYVGVIAKSIKPDGAELGWILSGCLATIVYVPARMLEKKYTGR